MADYLVYFAQDALSSTGIACNLDVPLHLPEIPVATEVRHSVFMAVKEAMNNAVKHAAPKEIQLELDVIENRITIGVTDDGKGFCVEQASGVGSGLENMRKRMRAVGGTAEFQTEPGCGTFVRFQVSIGEEMVATP